MANNEGRIENLENIGREVSTIKSTLVELHEQVNRTKAFMTRMEAHMTETMKRLYELTLEIVMLQQQGNGKRPSRFPQCAQGLKVRNDNKTNNNNENRPLENLQADDFRDWIKVVMTLNKMQRFAPVSISTLTSVLASVTPKMQRLMLGEILYPLVKCIEPVHTPKVTGMLLEMEQTEVLYLIESPNALKVMVAGAMAVLHTAASKTRVSDQLSALDLNE